MNAATSLSPPLTGAVRIVLLALLTLLTLLAQLALLALLTLALLTFFTLIKDVILNDHVGTIHIRYFIHVEVG